MTDNRTTELREKLTERGIEYEANDNMGACETSWNGFTAFQLTPSANLIMAVTPEQAIAATLGSDEPPYDELLRCLENDWHINASWDGLRKFWCIELTKEGMKLRDATHGTLTAEQVMAIAGKHQPDYCSDTHVCFDWQAIADELNARAERTCQIESSYLNDFTSNHECWYEFEMECGYRFTWDEMEPPNCCPNCGCKVIGG